MNELVEAMSIQAGLACDGTDFDNQAVQLFTEMIVNDCIEIWLNLHHAEHEEVAGILRRRYNVSSL